jgi:hypothetical protein
MATDGTRNKHGFQLEHLVPWICERAVRRILLVELKPPKTPVHGRHFTEIDQAI